MKQESINSLKSRASLQVGQKSYEYFNLNTAAQALNRDITKMPFSLKILFENLLRKEDGRIVTLSSIKALIAWLDKRTSDQEIAYYPSRVLMQDFTGVPAIVDLAAMRDAMQKLKGDPLKINPLIPVDLVIDHSVQVDYYATINSFKQNVSMEVERNQERYEFLRWGQEAFNNFRVVPPGTGICHQVNLEYLAKVVWTDEINGKVFAYPDSLVGTDSHTTMVNGVAVLGWGVGGIEAEAAMLGQAVSMIIPEVIGVKLTGRLQEGVTATDLVLTITQMLRKKGVVGKFVEFYGSGLDNLPVADRATIGNMAPEYGATCGFFPIDEETIKYLKLTGRNQDTIDLVRSYAKAQGLWRDSGSEPIFTDVLELDLGNVKPSLAGPKRPQDKLLLSEVSKNFQEVLPSFVKNNQNTEKKFKVEGKDYELNNGSVVIAAITSCTNTSNPSVMIAAGLVAKAALERGMNCKPWVKTSLAPGSKVVSEYLEVSGLQKYLDELGFNLVGYGCTTCIGNSGPLNQEIADTITTNDLAVASILSGNRNFEGRIHPQVKANYLASPPLVVAYALAGSVNINIATDPLGKDKDGKEVYLNDIWPSLKDINDYVSSTVKPEMFIEKYADVFSGDEIWRNMDVKKSVVYNWNYNSTYINNPPYFENLENNAKHIGDIKGAKLLALFGDSITTDHISPAGNIALKSPAAAYLQEHGIEPRDFNSYGSRRGNHEVMMRGTFANIRIKNELAPGTEGGFTNYIPSNEIMTIFHASMKYKEDKVPTIVIAGKEYGTGSSRDWAAKGPSLLGIKAIIAESFERIHRSNLVGMGILPLVFKDNMNRHDLNLTGHETFDILGMEGKITPLMDVTCHITYKTGEHKIINLTCRLDTIEEVEYFTNDGILHYVIRKLLK
ncbi:Aconitate hydratase 1 [Rickettsiales bacterium Ac37b]|nr:Aconitate hydratase 1 [Rickettsiales bacterium Ac37b]